MGTLGDFSPGNGIVAQALLSVSDVPPRFIDPGSLHSRTAGGAPCSSRRSASLLRPLGALGFGPTGRAQLQSPPNPQPGTDAHRRQWDWSLPPAVREKGRRNVGNHKERRKPRLCGFPGGGRWAKRWESQGASAGCDYVSSPEDEGRRSVGNRKECRSRHDYASFPGPQTPSSLRAYSSLL